MNKDAFYFPHFSNARHDRKIKRIIKELGVEGYGIFFMVLEVLREQNGMTYPMDDIDLLADEFRTSEQKVRTVICNYSLFEITPDQRFFSPKLIEYLGPYFKMKEQRKLAGLKSGEVRQRKASEQANDEQSLNDRSSTDEQSKEKERKGEESKDPDKRLSGNLPKKLPEPIPPKNPPKEEKDFINEIIDVFTESYFKSRGVPYLLANVGKERAAAGKLIAVYKKQYPESDSQETLLGLSDFFARCLEIKDTWLYNNMTLPIINSKLNEITQTLKNEKVSRNNRGATPEELARLVHKHATEG